MAYREKIYCNKHKNSPYNGNMLFIRQVRRSPKIINYRKSFWCTSKFSGLTLHEMNGIQWEELTFVLKLNHTSLNFPLSTTRMLSEFDSPSAVPEWPLTCFSRDWFGTCKCLLNGWIGGREDLGGRLSRYRGFGIIWEFVTAPMKIQSNQ